MDIMLLFGIIALLINDLSAYRKDTNVVSPTAYTTLGVIRGSTIQSRKGNTIYAFRGIPYAEPPINDLRFQPPKPVTTYGQELDATKTGNVCPQPAAFLADVISEDCLQLNVYTRKLPTSGQSTDSQNYLKPVFVYFHPGGFYSGSGYFSIAGPHYLLDHNIVVVTVNYRLGSLGFMSTGDKFAPGNNGLKDQVVALKWIRDNIASFNGNPNAVTIMGYSAGGMSVVLHMISPMSKGLFHRAICMSSSPTSQWPTPTNQLQLAKKQAQVLNCPDQSSEEIIACLRQKTAVEIGNSLSGLFEFDFDPVLLWSPVIEPDFGQERFLTENPTTSVVNNNFQKVPLMIGMTEFEFLGRGFGVLGNETLAKELDKNWNKLAPIAFLYERDTERSKYVSQELRKFYIGDRSLTNDNDTIFALGRLYGDSLVSFGVHRLAHLMSERMKQSVFYYLFTYKGKYSHLYYPGTQEPVGAVHHDELIYLYNVSAVFPPIDLQSSDIQASERLTYMWTKFTEVGNPTPRVKNAPIGNVEWKPLTKEQDVYLEIGKNLEMKQGLFLERFQEWDRLFPIK